VNQPAFVLGIPDLEETCVDCEGSGDLLTLVMTTHGSTFVAEECPRCKGLGRTLTPSGRIMIRFISTYFNLQPSS
jgi:phage FluMu protein Com